MAISTMDNLVAAMPGQIRYFTKTSAAPKAAGTWQSLWTAAGKPGPGTYPGASLAWSVKDNSTLGTLDFNVGSPLLNYLGRAAANAMIPGTLILYDRLAETGAITPAASTQTLTGGPTLTRPDALGDGVEMWWEWITASGATASNFSFRYTDQSGNTLNTSPAFAAQTTSVVGQMQQFSLATGDTGIRSADQFISTAAIGGTGQMVMMRRIAEFPIAVGGVGVLQDPFATGMSRVYDNAALAMMFVATSTATNTFQGSMSIISG